MTYVSYVIAGSQRSVVVCVEKEAGIVEDRLCNASTKPDDMYKSCNDHQCPARQYHLLQSYSVRRWQLLTAFETLVLVLWLIERGVDSVRNSGVAQPHQIRVSNDQNHYWLLSACGQYFTFLSRPICSTPDWRTQDVRYLGATTEGDLDTTA